MRRISVALGILGLVCATALPASAQKQITLFGKTYNVVAESRGQTYKNGKAVTLPDSGNKKANVYFDEGAAPAQDRLWISAAPSPGVLAHQIYHLEGADANGLFSKDSASLAEFFGGAVDHERGGRPTSIMSINRDNTGVRADRNVIAVTFHDTDSYRIFDLDTMVGVAGDNSDGTASDAVFGRVTKNLNPDESDPNLPFGSFWGFAHLPTPDGRTILVVGGGTDGGAEIGIWDTRTANAYNVLTNLNTITASATKKLPVEDANANILRPHSLARFAGDEYWMLYSNPEPGGDDDSDRNSNQLVRMKITPPANLASGTPESIKAEILDSQELVGTAKDILYTSGGGVVGVAIGREVAPGLRRLYFTDFNGMLYTATPVP